MRERRSKVRIATTKGYLTQRVKEMIERLSYNKRGAKDMSEGTNDKKKNAELKKKLSREVSPSIKYPKEVKFLEKSNKANEERYRRWLRKKNLSEELLGKSTLVIGLRGENGIVLGSDTKTIRGGETDFGDKLRILKINDFPIVFAAAGVVGVIEDFLEQFEKTLELSAKDKQITSLLSIKVIAENLVEIFEKRYGPRLGSTPITFIFGGLSNLDSGEARLYTVGSPGFGERIKYYSLIGHGSPYARTIGKYLFPIPQKRGAKGISLECKDIVHRLAATIYWIGSEVDDYVGGDPQIVYILDEKPVIREGKYNKRKIVNKVKVLKQDLSDISF